MQTEDQAPLWNQHRPELYRTGINLLIALLLGVFSYIWHSTTQDIDDDHRAIVALSERVRVAEIAAEGNRQLQISVIQRIDRLERWVEIPPGSKRRPGD